MVRNKEETKARILAAVGKLLAESGFQKIGVNAIAREAGVDKVLIYRYFKDLPSLLRVYAEEGDFWPALDEIANNQMLADEQRSLDYWIVKILIEFLHGLQQRPLTQEIILWELLERNELTDQLNLARKKVSSAVIEAIEKKGGLPPDTDIAAISAIVAAGIAYLVLRSRNIDEFVGIDLNSSEGWERIENAIALIIHKTLT